MSSNLLSSMPQSLATNFCVEVILTLRAQIKKKFQDRLKNSRSLEIFNPDLQNSPKNRGLVGGSLENVKLT